MARFASGASTDLSKLEFHSTVKITLQRHAYHIRPVLNGSRRVYWHEAAQIGYIGMNAILGGRRCIA